MEPAQHGFSQLARTGFITFPEVHPLEICFGDFASTETHEGGLS
jgi:hypothetical protein